MLPREAVGGKWSCGGQASSRMETVSVLVAMMSAALNSKLR